MRLEVRLVALLLLLQVAACTHATEPSAVPADEGAGSAEPCWCGPARARLSASRELLAKRYGSAHLDAAAFVQRRGSACIPSGVLAGTDGSGGGTVGAAGSTDPRGVAAATPATATAPVGLRSPLLARLAASLDDPSTAFRVGVLGGSMAVAKLDGGCWACNVTRWLNAVLAASRCGRQSRTLVDDRDSDSHWGDRGNQGTNSAPTGGTGSDGNVRSQGNAKHLAYSPTMFDEVDDESRGRSCVPLSWAERAAAYPGCSTLNRSSFAELPPLFCERPERFWDPAFGAAFHRPRRSERFEGYVDNAAAGTEEVGSEDTKRDSAAKVPMERVCDNDVAPRRPCTVFWGSGDHATLTNGAVGGTNTAEGTWCA